MFKKMMMKAMMNRQLKDLPQSMKDKIMKAVDENPGFFEKMAKEIDERVKKGEDKLMASQSVAMKYQGELQKIMMGN